MQKPLWWCLAVPKAGSNNRPEINFSKYSEDRIFLARLQSPMWGNSPTLVKSKREREAGSSRVVSQNKPETVVILARLSR
ncbi:MAG: hypothetical protein JNN08_17205 [Bryobacterales bacterium]|nr:hypothetical protein [Bryobacterales bacterium]